MLNNLNQALSGPSSEPRTPFRRFHKLEANHSERIDAIIHQHPVYTSIMMNTAFQPNDGYLPRPFSFSFPTVLGTQNLLSINNDRFPHPYSGIPFTLTRPKSLPLSKLQTSVTTTDNDDNYRTTLSDENPVIGYLNRDILALTSRQLYYVDRAPARPCTPVHTEICDPIPRPPSYQEPPPYRRPDLNTSRYTRAVIHQSQSVIQSLTLSINDIDTPPHYLNEDYLPFSIVTDMFSHTVMSPLAQIIFLFESLILIVTIPIERSFITFIQHPEATLETETVLSHFQDTLALTADNEIISFYQLPYHWFKFHSNSPIVIGNEELSLKCYSNLCLFNNALDFFPSTEDNIQHQTKLHTAQLTEALAQIDHTILANYLEQRFIQSDNLTPSDLTPKLVTRLLQALEPLFRPDELSNLIV